MSPTQFGVIITSGIDSFANFQEEPLLAFGYELCCKQLNTCVGEGKLLRILLDKNSISGLSECTCMYFNIFYDHLEARLFRLEYGVAALS